MAGLSWTGDDSILIGTRGGLIRVPTSGGGDSTFISAEESTSLYWSPHSLPNDTHAFVSIFRSGEVPRLAVISLETGEATKLPFGGGEAIYSPTGHIVFRQEGKLMAARFDLGTLRVQGQPQEIASGVASGPRLSDDGTMVYVAERADGTAGLVWVDRQGLAVPLGAERRDYTHIDVSPDGAQVLLDTDTDIYAYDCARGPLHPVTSDNP